MNYIKQLNAAFEKFYTDNRLNPTHISLYMALFQEWNSSRFAMEFFVNRRDIMNMTKIGSNSTYHRCVVDLDNWGYLSYIPSNNPFKGSKIKMSNLETADEPDTGLYDPELEHLAEQYHPKDEHLMYQHRPMNGQALAPYINNTKEVNNKQPEDRQAVLIFFKEKGFSADEGKKFLEYYEKREWKTSDGSEINDWKAVAKHLKKFGKINDAVIDRIILGNYVAPKDVHRRPLAKFMQDIGKEAGVYIRNEDE